MMAARRPVILFVDDSEMLLNGLLRLLHDRSDDWDMRTATGADEALALLETEAVDAVLSDLRMPGMGGDELIYRIRETWPGVRTALLCGDRDDPAAEAVRRSGCPVLGKPCRREQLLAFIDSLLAMQVPPMTEGMP